MWSAIKRQLPANNCDDKPLSIFPFNLYATRYTANKVQEHIWLIGAPSHRTNKLVSLREIREYHKLLSEPYAVPAQYISSVPAPIEPAGTPATWEERREVYRTIETEDLPHRQLHEHRDHPHPYHHHPHLHHMGPLSPMELGEWESEVKVFSDATPMSLAFVVPDWGFTRSFRFQNVYEINMFEAAASLVALEYDISVNVDHVVRSLGGHSGGRTLSDGVTLLKYPRAAILAEVKSKAYGPLLLIRERSIEMPPSWRQPSDNQGQETIHSGRCSVRPRTCYREEVAPNIGFIPLAFKRTS
ncbi:hypothetical protein J437_LFUL018763 [Ladona fulva]|uniref:Uncharacterized protein n=1 Tax=Ladona fulva TaxID=123851 RepID=A0A8K0PD14_LADFU|nr:hypothetical protein J437_LFUL018763 [Ladona fulva]